MTKDRVWDVRLSATKGDARQNLSLLVTTVSSEQARIDATRLAEEDGWLEVRIEWCIEYPPKKVERRSRAITDYD